MEIWVNQRKKLLIALLVFVVPFLWMSFLTENLPFSTMDDPTIHYLAKKNSFSTIASRIVNPLTPAWTYQFQAMGGEQNQLGLSPIILLIWKSIIQFAGDNPSAFYAFKSLILACLSSVLYVLAKRLTGRSMMAVLTSLFFCTTLSTYNSVSNLTAFDILAQTLMAISVLIFLQSYAASQDSKVSSKKFAGLCLTLFAMTWLSIKTYETTKIAPALFLGFMLVANLKRLTYFFQNRRLLFLVGLVLAMFILVIPFAHSYKVYDASGTQIKNPTQLTYHFDTLYRFTLQNTRNAWETEKDIAFFSLKSYLPFSLARTFGFFLCWAMVGSFIFSVSRIRSLKKMDRAKKSLVLFLALWTGVELVALGLAKESDGRHLLGVIIPLTLSCAFLISWVLEHVTGVVRKGLILFCLVGWIFAFVTNMNHSIYFRKFLGGINITQSNYMKFIYEHYHNKPLKQYDSMIEFMLVPKELCIWHIPFIIDDYYSHFDWRSAPPHLTKMRALHGKVYVVTADSSKFVNDRRYVRLAQFNEQNDSLYTKIMSRLKKKKSPIHFVYEFIPDKT